MPSPITHAAVGYAIYRLCRYRCKAFINRRIGPIPKLLLATMGLSLLPDLDTIPGLVKDDIGRYHNNVMSSLTFGLLTSLGVAGVFSFRDRKEFRNWFFISSLCYATHIIMDYFTVGGGVMLLWPFTTKRYVGSFRLFYGLRWTDGLISRRYLWTVITELGTLALILGIFRLLRPNLKGLSRT